MWHLPQSENRELEMSHKFTEELIYWMCHVQLICCCAVNFGTDSVLILVLSTDDKGKLYFKKRIKLSVCFHVTGSTSTGDKYKWKKGCIDVDMSY